MKKLAMLILVVLLMIINAVPVSARPEYSEETKRLMREAGLRTESADWDEIARRQQAYRNQRNQSAAPRKSATQPRSYGSKYSYDEFHTAPKDIQSNDGYGAGGFDELHINENYRQNVWHPEHRGNRLRGFDEFRYPDEM